MGCDLLNNGGKKMDIVFRDYDTGKTIHTSSIDIDGISRISYEIICDEIEER